MGLNVVVVTDNLGSHNDWIWKRKSRECKSLNYLLRASKSTNLLQIKGSERITSLEEIIVYGTLWAFLTLKRLSTNSFIKLKVNGDGVTWIRKFLAFLFLFFWFPFLFGGTFQCGLCNLMMEKRTWFLFWVINQELIFY